MGMLGTQDPRVKHLVSDQDIDNFLAESKKLSEKYKITIGDVIQAKYVLELERQNNIAIDDGDYRDEHTAGLGKCLNEIAYALQK